MQYRKRAEELARSSARGARTFLRSHRPQRLHNISQPTNMVALLFIVALLYLTTHATFIATFMVLVVVLVVVLAVVVVAVVVVVVVAVAVVVVVMVVVVAFLHESAKNHDKRCFRKPCLVADDQSTAFVAHYTE